MAHWLVKSEPDAWSWDQQVAVGHAGEPWTGVRNHLAHQHLRAMRLGDEAFFYHSNAGREIVGIVDVVGEHRPDPTDASGRFGCVLLRALRPLPRPVTLAMVKADPRLAGMALVRLSRLSVGPVSDAEWAAVMELAGA